jgi:hypothetical protein
MSENKIKTEKLPQPCKRSLLVLLPAFGSLLFIVLYFIATLYYPGGSLFDKSAKGFQWTQNYWCNLLNAEALNGMHNTARPIAFAAMFVLAVSLVLFWYLFPLQAGLNRPQRLMTQVAGLLAMIIGVFVFTDLHDVVINVASSFGLIALGGTFAGLYQLRWQKLFWSGLFILVLIGLNNLLYYDTALRVYLPVVQKLSFLYVLVWISAVSLRLYNRATIINKEKQST